MICPSCSYDNIEGADRCEECMTSLLNLDVPQAGSEGMASSVMEDDIRQLDQEFLGVSPDTPAIEVIRKMKETRLGCALVLEDGNAGAEETRINQVFSRRQTLQRPKNSRG